MRYRQLGSTDFRISTIGLGTWAIGGWMWGGQDSSDSIAAIHAALDAGVNWIDTAPIYGSGKSEEVTGAAIKQIPASLRPLIFTKFGLGDDSQNARKSATRAETIAECEASLKRLEVEQIDLFQLHWPAPQPIAETAGACDELLKSGKIRAIGVSNFNVEQLNEWMATGVPLHSLQAPYSILRPAAANDVLPWCAEKGVGAIAYSPLFRGMLFGTWTADKKFAPGDARGTHKDYTGPRFIRHLQAISELKALARHNGFDSHVIGRSGPPSEMSCAQLCIGALLCTPGLSGCIVGARNAVQGAALGRLGSIISDEQLKAMGEIIQKLQQDLASM